MRAAVVKSVTNKIAILLFLISALSPVPAFFRRVPRTLRNKFRTPSQVSSASRFKEI